MRKCIILKVQKPLDSSSKVNVKKLDVKEWVRTKTGRFNESIPVFKNLVNGDEIYDDDGESYTIFSTGNVEVKKTIKKFMEKQNAENS